MFRRRSPLEKPVAVTVDGNELFAKVGEPLAVALVAAGLTTLARSPKLHRPRAASCFRGACDGCLMRVDGVPNVMTCLHAVSGGERVEAQNILGTRQTDLLRVTDWFFPQGIDHHHLMAGIPGVSALMQKFARKMAGLGRLPDQTKPPTKAGRHSVDVLIVGGGLSGCAVARALEGAFDVMLVDEAAELGGSARFAGGDLAKAVANPPRASTHLGATLAGFYEEEALIVTSEGAELVCARAVVFATGAHDGVLEVPNNDLPGVMSARALAVLYHHGVEPKVPVVLVGNGPFAQESRERLGALCAGDVEPERLVEIHGSDRVKNVVLSDGSKITCGIVAIATDPSPSFELAQQAGAEIERLPAGYRVVTDAGGAFAPGRFAAGQVKGLAFDATLLLTDAERVARSVRSFLTE